MNESGSPPAPPSPGRFRAMLNRGGPRLTRRFRLWLIVMGSIAVVGGAFLWALPEIIRRTAVVQIPKLTGRAASIDDVDLNLFTGRLALKKLRLAERDPAEAFITADRIDLRISPLSLVIGHVRLTEFRLTTPTVRIVRTGPVEFNFSDLLARLPPDEPKKPKSRWTMSIERLVLASGAILFSDRAVSPAREWNLRGITVEAGGLTTRAAQQPGHVDFQARLNDAPFDANAGSIILTPGKVALHVSLKRFDLTQARPYLPPDLPVSLEAGMLGVAVEIGVEREGEALTRAAVSGDVRVEGLSLAQASGAVPFVTLPRATVAIKELDALGRSLVLTNVEVEGPEVKAVRNSAGDIDLLGLTKPRVDSGAPSGHPARVSSEGSGASESPPPSKPFKARVERFALKSGKVTVTDQAVSPSSEWRLQGLTVEGAGLSTSADDPPAQLKLTTQFDATGSRKPASLSVDVASLRTKPIAATARVALENFDLGVLGPYWFPTLPAVVRDGFLGVAVNADVEHGDAGLTRAFASGTARLDSLSVVHRDQSAQLLSMPKLTIALKKVDAVANTVALGNIAIEGVNVRVVRDATGKVDVVELANAMSAPAAASPAPAPARPVKAAAKAELRAGPPWKINLDRLDLRKGTGTFEDRTTSPVTTLTVTDLTAVAERVAFPSTTPATVSLSLNMPGGGRSEAKLVGKLEPLDLQIRVSTRDAPIEPYQPYFTFPARFLGFFGGDSLSEIQRAKDGTLIIASRGQASGRDMEVRAPGAETAVSRLSRMDIQGLDFSWPNYALVNRVTLTAPWAQIERDATGAINMRRLFTPDEAQAKKAASESKASEKPAGKAADGAGGGGDPNASRGPGQDMVIDFNEIILTDGYVRYLDRTTTPAFSSDLSKFTVTVRGASNQMGRQRTIMTASGTLGGSGKLELEGDLTGVGDGLRANLNGHLQDFPLPSANPYTAQLTAWNIKRGTFTTKFQYQVEGDRLVANQDLKFIGLQVERAQTTGDVPQRLGVPLGLAVALLKDSRGDIDFSIPLRGTLSDKNFDWGEAMWAGAKQAIVKLIVSPFNAIGRAITGGDKVEKLEVDPVTFAAASSSLAQQMEAHLTRVADFMRRAPSLKLTLTPAVSASDIETIKNQEVSARLERFRRERGLRDLPETLRVYYAQEMRDTPPPQTVDEQLALLTKRERVADGVLVDLSKRRVDVTRDRLVKGEGIPPERLNDTIPSAAPEPVTGEGRVEFGIATGDD